MPLIFIGALTKLLAGGRIAAAGAALAGFALVLYGLTTLQQGMGGLAESLHPSDLPSVLGAPGVGWLAGWVGLLKLVVVGLVMTAVMQSSTASIAVTISAFYAGAVGLEQGAALIVGQNIGTATSSALAAIGASMTAKRLALAYVLFKVIAALIALAAFPFTAALMARFSTSVDGTTLLAAYHTAYNVVGVAVLLPATQWFTRFVERLLPSKQSPLERALDPAALVNPVVAVEAARRAVAETLKALAVSVAASLAGGSDKAEPGVAGPAAALERVRDFLSELTEPPATEAERRRMTSTLHALDHASRLAEILGRRRPSRTGERRPRRSSRSRALQAGHALDGDDRRIRSRTNWRSAQRAEPIGWSISPDSERPRSPRSKARRRRWRRSSPKHRAAILASVASGTSARDGGVRADRSGPTPRPDRVSCLAFGGASARPRESAPSRASTTLR